MKKLKQGEASELCSEEQKRICIPAGQPQEHRLPTSVPRSGREVTVARSLESSVRRRNSGSARLQSGRQAKEQSVNRAQVRKERELSTTVGRRRVGGFCAGL